MAIIFFILGLAISIKGNVRFSSKREIYPLAGRILGLIMMFPEIAVLIQGRQNYWDLLTSDNNSNLLVAYGSFILMIISIIVCGLFFSRETNIPLTFRERLTGLLLIIILVAYAVGSWFGGGAP